MLARSFLLRRSLAILTVTVLGATTMHGRDAEAQTGAARHRVARNGAATDASIDYRGLTITRPPDLAPDPYSPDDTYTDGPIRYNDVHDFSPFPYADSGRQFPYGFDGIGGYGSDLGYNEGQDASVYDRGAFNREAR